MLKDSKSWTLHEKLVHWDKDYCLCEFPRLSDTLYEAPKLASTVLIIVNRTTECQEYIEAADKYAEDLYLDEISWKKFNEIE